jgi:hypothetical protein
MKKSLVTSGACATTGGEVVTPFQQSWLVLKNVQARLPGYEGKMIADDRRKRRRDGRGFLDEPREMGPFLSPTEEVLNKPQNREQEVARRRRPARIVRTFDSPNDATNQYAHAVTYALEDDAGERLAEIHADGGEKGENVIEEFAGEVPEVHRRKGYYRELIENLIRHGFALESSSRNFMSDPFHKKFIRTLPDDIDVDTTVDSGGDSRYDVHHYTHMPFFPGEHGPGGDWGDLRGPHRITVPFFDRSSEEHRPKDLEVPSRIKRMNPIRHRNRDIVVPNEAARQILAQKDTGWDHQRENVIRTLKNASRGYGKGIPQQLRNPSFGLVEGAPQYIDNPAYGSQLFVQTRLPGLYESDYKQNWGGPNFTQPLLPNDLASMNARKRHANYIQ